jgi:type IV pilus assembly protein PilY1
MNTHSLKILLLGIMLMIHLPVQAEDVDLFAAPTPAETQIPNVLIIVDNTANWNTAFSNEMAALKSVIDALPVDKFRVGFMMFTETGGGDSGAAGAYVRAAVRELDSVTKPKYSALVSSLDKEADKSNGGKVSMAMEEAYLYFAGLAPYSGNNKNKTDYAGNTFGTSASKAVYALANNALSGKAASPYNSPAIDGCANNYIIYISNGPAQDNNSDITQATNALATLGGDTTTIPISPSGSQSNVADEWARFMKASSLGITTYTIDIDKVTTGQGPGWTALLKSMANQSNGKYFDVSSATDSGGEILKALNSIFSEVQSVNSVFASVSLPVSVNTQGTFLNQVYIGMFRPDQNSFPRWNGNLKQYKLGFSGGVLKLLDADDNSAINSSTGFITGCGRSFWTPSAQDTYWSFRPMGDCLTPGSQASNSPDGNIVEKGAQAYQLRQLGATSTSITRTVKTCALSSCTSLTDFNTSNAAITQTSLGAADSTERNNLINWSRGVNNGQGEDPDKSSPTNIRPSIHGDVVHSRPVAINYGTDAAPQVVVFYGANDGMLRAINGNRSNSIGTTPAGAELWSFMAPEFYSKIKRIRDNEIGISFPGNTVTSPTPKPKDYGVDGPVTAYKNGTTAWIYSTMRRGGRALYAFDVSSVANPAIKWRIGCPNSLTDDTGCTAGFSALGQTWATPKIIQSAGFNAGLSPMIIMGGGYDTCHDADPNIGCSSSSKGNKIYLLNADTGMLLKTFNTDSSIIGDVTVLNDSAGLIRYAYAADLAGNIYRISGVNANTAIGTTSPADWTITKIAALGGTGTQNRKFMFAPDLVDENGTHILLLGSGDREKPLSSYTDAASVNNYFFMIKDRPSDSAWLSSENANCGSNVICLNSLQAIVGDTAPSDTELAGKKGWYLGLRSSERIVTSAITVFGTVTFSSFIPSVSEPESCSANLGTSTVYNINYKNAASANGTDSRGETIVGGGLPPSPVAGLVTLDDGSTVPFIIGSRPNSPLEGGDPPLPPSRDRPKSRVYWNIVK